jgi:hypothetical protein
MFFLLLINVKSLNTIKLPNIPDLNHSLLTNTYNLMCSMNNLDPYQWIGVLRYLIDRGIDIRVKDEDVMIDTCT